LVIDTALPLIFDSGLAPEINNVGVSSDLLQRRLTIDETNRTPFESFFQAALELANDVSGYQHASDIAQVNFATGKDTNQLTLILAQGRADSSLNFMTQVTNRIVEAYREIMRMQI